MSLGPAPIGWSKGLYIERHNEAVATAGKAIMEGAKGGCLAVLMADAGWHGKVTGLSVESRIPSQVLRGVPESMLCRMRPDMLLIEKQTGGDVLPPLHDLEHPRHRKCCRVHVVEVGLCTEVACAQKYNEKYEQHALCSIFSQMPGMQTLSCTCSSLVAPAACSNSQHCIWKDWVSPTQAWTVDCRICTGKPSEA